MMISSISVAKHIKQKEWFIHSFCFMAFAAGAYPRPKRRYHAPKFLIFLYVFSYFLIFFPICAKINRQNSIEVHSDERICKNVI